MIAVNGEACAMSFVIIGIIVHESFRQIKCEETFTIDSECVHASDYVSYTEHTQL